MTKRTEKLSTSVTPEEQKQFRILAIERDYSSAAALLRELVYAELEAEGHPTSRDE